MYFAPVKSSLELLIPSVYDLPKFLQIQSQKLTCVRPPKIPVDTESETHVSTTSLNSCRHSVRNSRVCTTSLKSGASYLVTICLSLLKPQGLPDELLLLYLIMSSTQPSPKSLSEQRELGEIPADVGKFREQQYQYTINIIIDIISLYIFIYLEIQTQQN